MIVIKQYITMKNGDTQENKKGIEAEPLYYNVVEVGTETTKAMTPEEVNKAIEIGAVYNIDTASKTLKFKGKFTDTEVTLKEGTGVMHSLTERSLKTLLRNAQDAIERASSTEGMAEYAVETMDDEGIGAVENLSNSETEDTQTSKVPAETPITSTPTQLEPMDTLEPMNTLETVNTLEPMDYCNKMMEYTQRIRKELCESGNTYTMGEIINKMNPNSSIAVETKGSYGIDEAEEFIPMNLYNAFYSIEDNGDTPIWVNLICFSLKYRNFVKLSQVLECDTTGPIRVKASYLNDTTVAINEMVYYGIDWVGRNGEIYSKAREVLGNEVVDTTLANIPYGDIRDKVYKFRA